MELIVGLFRNSTSTTILDETRTYFRSNLEIYLFIIERKKRKKEKMMADDTFFTNN